MDQYSDLASAPLIDFGHDLARDCPDVDTDDQQSLGAQEPTTQRGSSLYALETPATSTFHPVRSVRELIESLGSPIHSNTGASPPTSRRASTTPGPSASPSPPSPSPFDDPASFEEPDDSSDFRASDTASFLRLDQESTSRDSIDFVPSLDLPGIDPVPPIELIPEINPIPVNPIPVIDPIPTINPIPTIDPTSAINQTEHERTYQRDDTGYLELPFHDSRLSSSSIRAQPGHSNYRPVVPSWLNRPASPSLNHFADTPTRPRSSARPLPTRPAHPWTTDPYTTDRPDRFSRTTAHTTISDVLFNFDLDPASAADLIADACQTANQVGVSTHDLLSRSVFLGTTDLEMTPLCLEASRVDLEGGIELVVWLIENSDPAEVYREVKKGCLMRRCGMGEQGVWNVLRGFVPEVDGKEGFAYDVDVEGLAVVPGVTLPGPGPAGEMTLVEDEDGDGSLYDDVSIIDAEFLDQADIETLKSSDDDKGKEPEKEPEPEPIPSRVHRARIVMPSFKESLLEQDGPYTYLAPLIPRFGQASRFGPGGPSPGIKVLTAEWMFEGRVWAFSMGEDSLLLTLRQTSELVSSGINVTAVVRILPLDFGWSGIRELDRIGPDTLLPTQTPSDVLLPSPLYQFEFGEKELVPGPVGLGMNSSVWKTDIRVSMFSLLELAGNQSGFKVEVVVRVVEREKVNVPSTSAEAGVCPETGACAGTSARVEASGTGSIPDDASDWQFVDD